MFLFLQKVKNQGQLLIALYVADVNGYLTLKEHKNLLIKAINCYLKVSSNRL